VARPNTELDGFTPLPRITVTAAAVARIKQMILRGTLRPGERLPSERALSEALGVSRPTLRESIRSLEAMNILETRQGAGTFVASLDLRTLLEPLEFAVSVSEAPLAELFEVRFLLEPGAAALAAERATEDDLAALERCVEVSRRPVSREEFLALDIELHRIVAEAAHNDYLVRLLASMSALAAESRALTVGIAGVVAQSTRDHEVIAAAIGRREPDAAREAMREHLRLVREAAQRASRAADG